MPNSFLADWYLWTRYHIKVHNVNVWQAIKWSFFNATNPLEPGSGGARTITRYKTLNKIFYPWMIEEDPTTPPCEFCDREEIDIVPQTAFTIHCGGKECGHRKIYGLPDEKCRQVILKQ